MSFSRSLCLALALLPLNAPFASTCSDSESLKTLMDKGEYRSALQEMDKCLAAASKQASAEEQALFNDLMKQVLTADESTSSEEIYRNVQSVLKIHSLRELQFEFAQHFKMHPTDDAKLFSKVRQAQEKYHFYYDTGRVFSHSRGFALTDQSLIWKNITGKPKRLAFDNIKSITLLYERGLSLTGWKLRLNNLENNDIRLSGVPDEGIIPLVSAMIHFINFNKSSPEMVTLTVPDKEVAILAGWVTLCSDKHVDQGDPIKNLQLLDACFSKYDKRFKLSQTDNELLSKLTISIFEKRNILFTQGYNNFKTVLSTHFFSDLKLNFKNNIDAQTRAKLFKSERHNDESYYFYFDTGKVTSGSRGLVLTDKSIIFKNLLGSSISWRNLTGSATRLPFNEISSVTLVHKIGFDAITGWKLRLNGDENDDIVLSGVCEDNVELFASALVYFINIASAANLSLEVPAETRDVLTKSFLERHPKIKSLTDSVFEVLLPKSSE